jgi:site-specific DNA-methyltransferase (adenine-specific)
MPHYNIKEFGTEKQEVKKRYPIDVVSFTNRNSPSLHPTQKPLDLIKYLILTYSNENDLIFDPFAGSDGDCLFRN